MKEPTERIKDEMSAMRRLRRRWRVVVSAGVVFLGVVLAVGGVRAVSGAHTLQEASADISELEPRLQEFRDGSFDDLESIRLAVGEIQRKLVNGRGKLTPFLQLAPLLGWTPRVGDRLRSAGDLVDIGQGLLQASQDLLSTADIVVPTGAEGTTQLLEGNSISEGAVRSIARSRPFFRSALDNLERVRVKLDRVADRSLPQELEQLVATATEVIPDLEVLARAGLTASQSWEAFLGFDQPRSYLVIAQNADELRATGGFIPGAWLVTFDKGVMTGPEFWDTVAVDDLSAGPPLPPEGLLQSLWAGVWLFRDATWHPDFPTSAKVVEQIFKLGQGISVDGVIALNQWAMGELLSAIGPVTLPNQPVLGPTSFMEVLEQTTDTYGRGYLGTVMDSLLDRFREQGSRRDMLSLLAALNQSLRKKEILLLFHDADLQAMVRANGWDGSLASRPGDFLMVVDSNVGFSKVNRNIEQSIVYQVDLDPSGSAKARLDLVYTNRSVGALPSACSIQSSDRAGPSYEQAKNACYWDYLRVYVPEGSTFNLSTPFPMPEGALYRTIGYNDVEDTFRNYQESGREVFAGLFKLAPGASRRLAFVYELPQGTIERDDGRFTYTLTVQKQSGRRNTRVEVVVRMPEGYSLRDATPSPSSIEEGVVTFSLVLDTDVEFRIEFAQ